MKQFIICGAALLMTACSGGEKEYDATGTFEATEVTVSAEQTGRLMSLNVTEGDKLAIGQQVGVIDTVQLVLKAQQLGATRQSIANQRPDTQKQIAALRQQVSKAEQEVRRFEGLVKDQAANRKQLEDAQSQLAVLRKQLEAQQTTLNSQFSTLNSQMSATEIQRQQVLDQLSKCYIAAPIAGTVLETYAEQGEFATIGKPLFKMADLDVMTLRAYITADQYDAIKVGQRCQVLVDKDADAYNTFEGVISWISPRAEFTPKTIQTKDERANLVYAIKIRVKNDGSIKIGQYGEVRF